MGSLAVASAQSDEPTTPDLAVESMTEREKELSQFPDSLRQVERDIEIAQKAYELNKAQFWALRESSKETAKLREQSQKDVARLTAERDEMAKELGKREAAFAKRLQSAESELSKQTELLAALEEKQREQQAQLDEAMAAAQGRISSLTNRVVDTRRAVQEIHGQINETEAALKSARSALTDKQRAIAKLKDRRESDAALLDKGRQQLARHEALVVDAERQAAMRARELEKQVKAALTQVATREAEHANFIRVLESKNAKHDQSTAEAQQEIEALTMRLAQQERAVQSIQDERTDSRMALEAAEQELDLLRTRHDTVGQGVAEASLALDRATAALAEQEAALRRLEADGELMKSELLSRIAAVQKQNETRANPVVDARDHDGCGTGRKS